MFSLLYLLNNWCITEYSDKTEENIFTDRELTLESRHILDKIALTMLKAKTDNDIIINGLLKLSKMERIIIVLNIMNEVDLFEIAFLLNANMNSIYVQKKSALEKLRVELSKHFHCGVIKYEEVGMK